VLTRLKVRNFKTLEELDIEIGQTVVFIGPNNSGKSSALQALALWQSGVREWLARRAGSTATIRPGVTLNRLALTHTPISEARLLWRNLRVNAQSRVDEETTQKPIFIDVLVEGQEADKAWSCGLEFYYGNPESIYCRPLRLPSGADRMEVPAEAADTKIAFLPPMSGLATEETEVPEGRIDVLIGEGQTAQVLRNLCLRVYEKHKTGWTEIRDRMKAMFGVVLSDPARDKARGSIRLTYKEHGNDFDIASAGRGLQQTLLLLSHVFANPGSVLLLDEPDAHLEILRQRQIYNVLTECAQAARSQVIAASHSEIVLNEAAERDSVIAFVGKRPHPIIDRGSQLLKSLREIGFDQYYQADLKGSVLYLEGATDLSVLRAFARKLNHKVSAMLEQPFVHYVANQPRRAEQHFFGLREARPNLVAFALFDRLDRPLPGAFGIPARCWTKCEIENYLVSRDVMLAFAQAGQAEDLVGQALRSQRHDAMQKALIDVEAASLTLGIDLWSDDIKASERVLPPLFDNYYKNLGIKNEMSKADFHALVDFIEPSRIDAEVVNVLDDMLVTMERAESAGS
jgi:predicted ATPase